MSKAGTIKNVSPKFAIPGGEIIIECEGFNVTNNSDHGCSVDEESCRVIAASPTRVIAAVSENCIGPASVRLESGGDESNSFDITIGNLLAEEMHLVANPAVDPKDDSIILTRSGSRGQQLPFTLYRYETDGYLDEMPAEIMNPTGIAFDGDGALFVTNRASGEVCRIDRGEEVSSYASGLGVATGLAFDACGVMYVGDRSGTIFRIPEFGHAEPFAELEPSVSAFHMAFGPDERLYVAAPGLASYDAVYAIDKNGDAERFFRGFGRPQGLAFDRDGNLYIAACYKSRHGIVKINSDGLDAELFAAGNNVVGLCFTREGEMVVATNDSAYSLPVGVFGTLLDQK